jgi:hypothetical protein
MQNGGMSSKYDAFWTACLGQIGDGIRLASTRGYAAIALSGLRDKGERSTWHGTADVRGRQVVRSSMAHATSLARIVARSGLCDPWPERTVRFIIGAAGDELTIRADAGSPTRISPKPMHLQLDKPADIRAGAQGRNPHERQGDTDEFYAILSELARRVHGPRLLRDCTSGSGWPSHGVYFFYETGELRPNKDDRIVRVGTHAITEKSQTTLWVRLRQHRGGRSAGGGNHRASVFRRHVGAALIHREGLGQELLGSWLDRHHPRPEMAEEEAAIETKVSRYIGDMPFLWLDVPERSDRDCIERNSIGLLSCRIGGLDIPGADWLGHNAERAQIRDSGLWNVEHVDLHYNPRFLVHLAELIHHSGLASNGDT